MPAAPPWAAREPRLWGVFAKILASSWQSAHAGPASTFAGAGLAGAWATTAPAVSTARAATAKAPCERCFTASTRHIAWTTSTAYVAPAAWQVPQASAGAFGLFGKKAVFRNAGAATSRLSWQPVQADVAEPRGEKKSRPVMTGWFVIGSGSVYAAAFAWHLRQSRRSPGYVTSLNVDTAPPNP